MKQEHVPIRQTQRFCSPVVCNFGIRIRCGPVGRHVYDVKVNHRPQILECSSRRNQHCGKISGSRRETVIEIAVITSAASALICGVSPRHLSSRAERGI